MSSLFVSLGFDCDRPRGAFIDTPEGQSIAEQKLESIQKVSDQLNKLDVKRTFFICGMFLESMALKFGERTIVTAFDGQSQLVEIADHSYSHRVLKPIATRKDKTPMTITEIKQEYDVNTLIFSTIFGRSFSRRGYRAPLGYYGGLRDCLEVTDTLLKLGVLYVSSDLRDETDSLCPELCSPNGELRQPYFYPNGLLEIPSTGWQDTVFSGTTKTPLFKKPPSNYSAIIQYYRDLFIEARTSANGLESDCFLGLVLHPFDISIYDKQGCFLADLISLSKDIGFSFLTYADIRTRIVSSGTPGP